MSEILNQINYEYLLSKNEIDIIFNNIKNISNGKDKTLVEMCMHALNGGIVIWNEFENSVTGVYESTVNYPHIPTLQKLLVNLKKCNYLKRKEVLATYMLASEDEIRKLQENDISKYNLLDEKLLYTFGGVISSEVQPFSFVSEPARVNYAYMYQTLDFDIPYDLVYRNMNIMIENHSSTMVNDLVDKYNHDPYKVDVRYDQLSAMKTHYIWFSRIKEQLETMSVEQFRNYKMSKLSIDPNELQQMISEIENSIYNQNSISESKTR